MEIIVASSARCVSKLEARQVASIAWSCGQLSFHELPDLMPILLAVEPLLDSMPAQQVGWLADSHVLPWRESTSMAIQKKLETSIAILQKALGDVDSVDSPHGFHETSPCLRSYTQAVLQLGADQIGTQASRALLAHSGISSIHDMSVCPQLHECHLDLEERHPIHLLPKGAKGGRIRVKAFLSFQLKLLSQELEGSYEATSGLSVQSSFRARSSCWLSPIPLPLADAERSLCGEFQVLDLLCARLCEVLGESTAGSLRELSGKVTLYVTATPCLSCVAVLRQFHSLFPAVQMEVSWERGRVKKALLQYAEQAYCLSFVVDAC